MLEWMKKEIAGLVRPECAFLLQYPGNKCSADIYRDILKLLHEVFEDRTKPETAVRILAVYSAVLPEPKAITIREVYYKAKRVHPKYSGLLKTLERIQTRLNKDLVEINIVPSLKGLVFGTCTVSGVADLKPGTSQIFLDGASVIPRSEGAANLLVDSDAEAVIVFEKEAVFLRAAQNVSGIEAALGRKVLLVTGKGYPCSSTFRFLMGIKSAKIFGIFDCDPHGLQIYLTYKYGSRKRPHLRVPGMERIGVSVSHMSSFRPGIHRNKSELNLISSAESRDTASANTLESLGESERALLAGIHKKLSGSGGMAVETAVLMDVRSMLNHAKKASIEDVLGASGHTLAQYIAVRIKETSFSRSWVGNYADSAICNC